MYKKISIEPQYKGYLYIDNVFSKILEPGVYNLFKPFNKVNVYFVSPIERDGTITNQEVMTKDNISFRVSQYYKYEIIDGQKYIENCISSAFEEQNLEYTWHLGDERLSKLAQERLREIIAEIQSEEINSKRIEIEKLLLDGELLKEAEKIGVRITKIVLLDLTFPKAIQEIFASELASKVRARTDLENARTAVASARTYKNATEMMKGDEGMQYLQLLETMQKIAQKGNHTFVIGENLNNTKRS